MSSKECPATTAGETLSQQSESSSSLTSPLEVTVEKYQRLASEYAKLRSHFQVLRKAMVEEQTKHQDTQQSLRVQDQNVRRLEQERESLLFRNKQLTKRVAVLQAEWADLVPKPAVKPRSSFLWRDSSAAGEGESTSTSAEITSQQQQQHLLEELSQELKTKTEQNEMLRQMTEQLEQKLIQETEHCQHELETVRQDADRKLAQNEQQMSQLQASLATIQGDHDRLLDRCREMEENLCELRSTVENLSSENKALKQRHNNNLELMISRQLQKPPAGTTVMRLRSGGPNKSYQDLAKRQDVIEQLARKLSVFICALSTLHSNLAQKISIMFALFNKNSNHLYFLDFHTPVNDDHDGKPAGDHQAEGEKPDGDNEDGQEAARSASPMLGQYRSMSVMSILRKLRDYLKMGYDTYLVHLEDAINQYSELKIRQQQQIYSGNENQEDSKDSTLSNTELCAIEQELTETSIEIVETFADYVSYLNKLNVYITIILNLWCKQIREYDPNNPIIQVVVEPGLQAALADCDKRAALCEKNESLMHSVTAYIRCIGHICNHVQLLLSKSPVQPDFLTAFNQFMHRVEALERCLEETKRVFSSKVMLEHDLGVTTEPDLKSMDDCILSSLVFLSKCVQEIRLLLETHYFFFVDHQGRSPAAASNSSMVLNGTGDTVTEQQPSDADVKLKWCQDRLERLEEERLQWSQVASQNLEREQQRTAHMEARCQELMEHLDRLKQERPAATATTADDARLLERLESAEARAMAYQHDCRALRQRLLDTDQRNRELASRIREQETAEERLREEYRTSVDNYETQLQAMSEHMATLNERLTDQRDQIDALKLAAEQPNNGHANQSSSVAKNLRRSFTRR